MRGPDDGYTLHTLLLRQHRDLKLDEILAIMRLVDWDIDVMLLVVPTIVARVADEPAHLREELHRAVRLGWEDFYPCNDERDVAARAAIVLTALGAFDEARDMLAVAAAATAAGEA